MVLNKLVFDCGIVNIGFGFFLVLISLVLPCDLLTVFLALCLVWILLFLYFFGNGSYSCLQFFHYICILVAQVLRRFMSVSISFLVKKCLSKFDDSNFPSIILPRTLF